jgi:pimeloyl-ACP methyl ester carboxylesterase
MSDRAPLPVVFVHGLIGTLDDEELLEHFSPRQVLAPDLLGYGKHAGASPERIDLNGQADHVRRVIDVAGAERVHLVGHSVGGVVAALVAHRHPHRVASLVSVEGNFTLSDAFWSAKVARMTADEVERMLNETSTDPARWLRDAGVLPDERRLALAQRWLWHQPASTVQAMARAVVDTTSGRAYERILRAVFERTPMYLVAGERSRAGWNVPAWALSSARGLTVIPRTGHLMMAEDPPRFAETIGLLLADTEAREAAAQTHPNESPESKRDG